MKKYVNEHTGEKTIDSFNIFDVIKFANKIRNKVSDNVCIDYSRIGHNNKVKEATEM
jgi:hypothetical protein